MVPSTSGPHTKRSVRWGRGSAPVLIGYIAGQSSLSFAISIAAIALVIGSALLLIAILVTVTRDMEKVRIELHNR